MSKILYVNQLQLNDPNIAPVLTTMSPCFDWKRYQDLISLNQHAGACYWRTGINNFPFKNDLIDSYGFGVPTYDPSFDLSFTDITDQLACDLLKTKKDKPWLMLYSGGIDSTVMIVALLKNLSKDDRSNVVIACSQHSVVENPRFFYNHIRPNFQIVDSTSIKFGQELLQKYHTFDGSPADQLYGPGIKETLATGNKSLLKDWRRDPDELLQSFERLCGIGNSHWYYELARENIDSTDIPVNNYYDFFWWTAFNLWWPGEIIQQFKKFQKNDGYTTLETFRNNFNSWYSTADYQRWSMNNHLDVRYSTNLAHRKLGSKQYIYEFDRNEYYYHFKTKSASIGRPENIKSWFCLTDDNQSLYLDRDLDQILSLLPDHINRS
jgi:hypothetical protein